MVSGHSIYFFKETHPLQFFKTFSLFWINNLFVTYSTITYHDHNYQSFHQTNITLQNLYNFSLSIPVVTLFCCIMLHQNLQ